MKWNDSLKHLALFLVYCAVSTPALAVMNSNRIRSCNSDGSSCRKDMFPSKPASTTLTRSNNADYS